MLFCSPVTVSVSATPLIVRNQTDVLSGFYDDVKQVSVHTVVTLVGSIYTYNYTLTYTQGNAAIHIFSVDNPNNVVFSAAATDSGFALPVYEPYSMIQWGDNDGPFIAQGGDELVQLSVHQCAPGHQCLCLCYGRRRIR